MARGQNGARAWHSIALKHARTTPKTHDDRSELHNGDRSAADSSVASVSCFVFIGKGRTLESAGEATLHPGSRLHDCDGWFFFLQQTQRRILEEQYAANPPAKACRGSAAGAPPAAAPRQAVKRAAPAPQKIPEVAGALEVEATAVAPEAAAASEPSPTADTGAEEPPVVAEAAEAEAEEPETEAEAQVRKENSSAAPELEKAFKKLRFAGRDQVLVEKQLKRCQGQTCN